MSLLSSCYWLESGFAVDSINAKKVVERNAQRKFG